MIYGREIWGERTPVPTKHISILDCLYPRRCVICDDILTKRERYLCGSCRSSLCFLHGPACFKCGAALKNSEAEYCINCKRIRHSFERNFAPFVYTLPLKKSLIRFKYAHRAEYSAFYAKAILLYGKELLLQWNPDVIIPVPVHQSRLLERGYNQAQLVAEKLGSLLGVKVDCKSVKRRKKTQAQKALDNLERRKNLSKAFYVVDTMPLYKRVLLVDDIFTTGSTMDTLASLLKRHGVSEVYCACIAIGVGFGSSLIWKE